MSYRLVTQGPFWGNTLKRNTNTEKGCIKLIVCLVQEHGVQELFQSNLRAKRNVLLAFQRNTCGREVIFLNAAPPPPRSIGFRLRRWQNYWKESSASDTPLHVNLRMNWGPESFCCCSSGFLKFSRDLYLEWAEWSVEGAVTGRPISMSF